MFGQRWLLPELYRLRLPACEPGGCRCTEGCYAREPPSGRLTRKTTLGFHERAQIILQPAFPHRGFLQTTAGREGRRSLFKYFLKISSSLENANQSVAKKRVGLFFFFFSSSARHWIFINHEFKPQGQNGIQNITFTAKKIYDHLKKFPKKHNSGLNSFDQQFYGLWRCRAWGGEIDIWGPHKARA